jgi:adenosylcobyric acid synthase
LHAQAPVLIVGDIDRGGVFAHFYGTHALLEPDEQALVKGFVINRFRGDRRLLDPAPAQIEQLTGVPVVGVVPWIERHGIPEEDAVAIERRRDDAREFDGIDVAVIALPRIANFDDFDPLEAERDVRVRYVQSADRFGDPDVVVLPGTKSTMADLAWLRERRLDACVMDAGRRGAAIIGVCGGFQMLGERIEDPEGVEGDMGGVDGLGLLRCATRFHASKRTRQSVARVVSGRGLLAGLPGTELAGYEIHAGDTSGEAEHAVALAGTGQPLGAIDDGGWTFGCYLHGLFHSDAVRQRLLSNAAAHRGRTYLPSPPMNDDAAFDALAATLRSSLDMSAIHQMLGLSPRSGPAPSAPRP